MAVDKYSNSTWNRLLWLDTFFSQDTSVRQTIGRICLSVMLALPVFAVPSQAIAQTTDNTDEKLFNDPPATDKGWQGLANVLEALSPGVDTSLPLTPSQITDRIEQMINQGRAQEALEIIQKRKAQRAESQALGEDVQLMFLHARALAATGRENEAEQIYRDMTITYPELPEPWNNLASIYIKQKQLDRAQDALSMALSAFPEYDLARYNLGQVQLMQAYESFSQAGQSGIADAAQKAQDVQRILE
jgi:tetratricopeptide (TPR) repeat protein